MRLWNWKKTAGENRVVCYRVMVLDGLEKGALTTRF